MGAISSSDLTNTSQELKAAKRVLIAAVIRVCVTRFVLLVRQSRLWAVQYGIPSWILGLCLGILVSLSTAILFIVIVGAGLVTVLVISLFSTLICVGGLLIPLDGENRINCILVRSEKSQIASLAYSAAIGRVRIAAAEVVHCRQQLKSIQQSLIDGTHQKQVETDRLLGIIPSQLSPYEFEHFVADIFRNLGFAVEVTGQTGDQGVDVLACRGQLRLAVQAKRYVDGSVSNSAVQEVYAGMAHYKCHRCVVVTTSKFTSGALNIAQSTNCLLVDGEQIPSLIRGDFSFEEDKVGASR